MRKPKKPSAYSQKRTDQNIVNFVAEKIERSYRVEHHGTHSGSTLKLVVPFPELPGGEKAVDISFLLSLPMLWEPFSEALSATARMDASPFVTVDGACRNLKNGLIKYLLTINAEVGLGDISTTVLENFIVWLRRTKDGIALYKKMSRQHFQMAATSILKHLQESETWKAHLSPELNIRNNYWAGEHDDRQNVEIIPDEIYRDIYIACKTEIGATIAKVLHQRALMQAQLNNPIAMQGDKFPADAYHSTGKPNLKVWEGNPYKDLGLCLAALRHRVPNVILSITKLTQMQDKLLLRVVEGTQPFGSIPQLHYCFYPYARDLVPFILMLAVHFDYNPETILKSCRQDFVIRNNEIGSLELVASPANINYAKEQILDDPTERSALELEILARAKKGRSNHTPQRQIRPATSAEDNPGRIVQFLDDWMSFVRPLASPVWQDRLFLFATEQKDRVIKSFSGVSTAGNDHVWRNALRRFYKDHGLPHVALNRFRPTGLDLTDALFGGDIRAKQAAGNHASPQTTYRLYSTNAQMQRGDEFLGQVGQLRERWRKTRGKVDPRNRPDGADAGAATPGWTCADPYSGPYTPSKLCTSYGACPNCRHGAIALNDPYACAQAWNLLAAINEAASEISPNAWLTKWAPVKKKLLEIWLPRFPNSVQYQAKRMTLAKLPPLE